MADADRVIGGDSLTARTPMRAVGEFPPDIQLAELVVLAGTMGHGRWRLVSDVAQVVASYLRCHPRVEAVRYPGLKDDPLFAEAACTLVGGFGPFVDFRVAGEWRRVECGPGDPREAVMQLEYALAAE